MNTILFDPSGRLRWFWRFSIFCTGMLVILIGVNVVAGLGLMAYLSQVDPGAMSDPKRLAAYGESPALMLLVGPLMTALSVGWVVGCRRFLDRRSVASMGMRLDRTRPENSLWAGFALGVGLIAVGAAVLWVAGAASFRGPSMTWQVVAFVPLLIVMAFFEELVCRSYLLQNFVDVGRPVLGIGVTSLIFALVHGMNPAAWSSPLIMINLFLAGILLALAYLAGRSVWFATAVHYGWNLAQGPVFGFAVSGMQLDSLLGAQISEEASTLLTGGAFGLEGSLLCTVLEVLVIGYFLGIGRLRGEPLVPPAEAPPSPTGPSPE